MDIFIPGLRDRRIAAADETHAPAARRGGGPRDIFGDGTAARRRAGVLGTSFDLRRVAPSRGVESINTVVLHQITQTHAAPMPDVSTDTDITHRHSLDHVIAHFIVRTDGTLIFHSILNTLVEDGSFLKR